MRTIAERLSLTLMAFAMAALLVAVPASPIEAQLVPATEILGFGPEIGWAKNRRLALGARGSLTLRDGVRLVGQGLYFFPDNGDLVEPGFSASQRWWQTNMNLLSAPASWGGWFYLGVGASYTRRALTLTGAGTEASSVQDRWAVNGILGMQIPGGGRTPFVELKKEIRDGPWMVSAGFLYFPM